MHHIESLLSSKKVEIYKKKNSEGWFLDYSKELNNVKESFIYLHFLEIFLRNRISEEFQNRFGEWVFEESFLVYLKDIERKKIEDVKIKLRRSKKEENIDNVVSNLNLGFWVNLFHKNYRTSIWEKDKVIIDVFPFFKREQRSLTKVKSELEAIRKFRNRVFHFENMQSWDFDNMNMLIKKYIYGISSIDIDDLLKV